MFLAMVVKSGFNFVAVFTRNTCDKWVLSIGVTLGFRITSFLKIGVPFLALQAGVVILWKLDDREFSLVFKKK